MNSRLSVVVSAALYLVVTWVAQVSMVIPVTLGIAGIVVAAIVSRLNKDRATFVLSIYFLFVIDMTTIALGISRGVMFLGVPVVVVLVAIAYRNKPRFADALSWLLAFVALSTMAAAVFTIWPLGGVLVGAYVVARCLSDILLWYINAGHTAAPNEPVVEHTQLAPTPVPPTMEELKRPGIDKVLQDYGAALDAIRFCLHCGRRTTPRHSQSGDVCSSCGNRY